MRIELACKVCGKNRFAFPEGGGDEAVVACEDCGHVVGTMGDLKQAVAAAVVAGTHKPRIPRNTKDPDREEDDAS